MKPFTHRLLCLSALLGLASFARADLAVIVNPNVAQERLDPATLKEVLLGRKVAWTQAGRIKLAILKSGDHTDAFLQKNAGMNASAFNNHWRRLAMTGAGSAPKSFADEAELRAFVATTEGAIGFIDATNVDASVTTVPLP